MKLLLIVSCCLFAFQVSKVNSWAGRSLFRRNKNEIPFDMEYDLVIIGAGASGMFASGASTMLGSKTLLLDTSDSIGGDCTNSACVPSKAIRSIGRLAEKNTSISLSLARQHATATVQSVQSREDPAAIVTRNPNLDIALVSTCHFLSPHEMILCQPKGY